MPDTTETTTETPVAPSAEPAQVTPAEPHPLEPGGKRFDEVYRDMKDARRETDSLRGEVERLRAEIAAKSSAAAQPAQQQPKWYTPQQLQAMIDAGAISAIVASDQLAWQRAQEAKSQLAEEQRSVSVHQGALKEVNEYMDRLPALRRQDSDEFIKVKKLAIEIGDELRLPIEDPRVQRRALREAFGTIDRVTAAAKAKDTSRERGDTFAEVGGGGGRERESASNPLKGVPKHYLDHWARLKYTPEQMAEEAKYVRRG